MTIKELREHLSNFPEDMVVMVHEMDNNLDEYFCTTSIIQAQNYKGENIVLLT